MNKIGVLLDCNPYWGGSFQYAMSLVNAIVRCANSKDIKMMAFIIENEWKGVLEIYDEIEIVELRKNYYLDAHIIDGSMCDIIFAASQSNWAECLKSNVVTPIHDLMHRYESRFPEVSAGGEYERRDWMFHSIVENSIGVFADSQVGKRQICEQYGCYYADKVYVLPFCVPSYLEEKQEPIELPFEKYVFYPAQFWKHKNHLNLLKAINILKRNGTEVKCVFSGGKKNGYDEIIEYISKERMEKDICILGYVSNAQIKYLYKNAKALIMPTYFGPTNIPPIEAITLGCPVAVSDVYGMREQLGDCALYFDPNDVENIASIIERLWTDNELCEKIKKIEEENAYKYTPEIFYIRFANILNEIEKKSFHLKTLRRKYLDFCEKHKRIYIYGAGKYATYTMSVCNKLGIKITAILVSRVDQYNTPCEINGIKVIAFDGRHIDVRDGYICSVGLRYQKEIMDYMILSGVNKNNIMVMDELEIEQLYREEKL